MRIWFGAQPLKACTVAKIQLSESYFDLLRVPSVFFSLMGQPSSLVGFRDRKKIRTPGGNWNVSGNSENACIHKVRSTVSERHSNSVTKFGYHFRIRNQ